MLFEKPDFSSDANLWAVSDHQMRLTYTVDFNSIQKKITVVTDGAANMDRMANSSIISRLVRRDEKWTSCLVHVVSKFVKIVFQGCREDSVLARVRDNFRAVKRIVEDSKRYVWNKNLPLAFIWFKMLRPDLEQNYY